MKKDNVQNLDKRKFPRVKDNIFIRYLLGSSSYPKARAVASDISAGGLMFETEESIIPGDELEMEIYQPVKRSKNMIFAIPVLAKVIWRRTIPKDNFEQGENSYRLGLKFLEIKEKDREIISNYVVETAQGR